MASTAGKTIPDEASLSALLLHKRVLTEGQLKAALDYQRSRGGRLFDVLVKLELIREQTLEELLDRVARGDVQATASEDNEAVLAEDAVNLSELKVHRRLLDKVPKDLVQKYLLVLFFPAGNLSLRKIILGHGREIPSDLADKLHSLLGVELYTLGLKTSMAVSFLKDCGRAALIGDVEIEDEESAEDALQALDGLDGSASASRKQERRKRKERDTGKASQDAQAASRNSSEILLRALVSLLAKKGLISREEFEEELEDAVR